VNPAERVGWRSKLILRNGTMASVLVGIAIWAFDENGHRWRGAIGGIAMLLAAMMIVVTIVECAASDE
jgi:hypothetical protein